MKRKKTEETPESAKFWPVPGVDGEPYPPLVQEALDLVAKETLRRKRAECEHKDRKFITGRSPMYYRRACRDCHLVVDCEHPEEAQHRQRVKHIGDGSFLEYWECRCGKLVAKRLEPRVRTANYGFPYERQDPPRQTGTDWLRTEEQERQERRTDRHVSRQIQRVTEKLDRDLQALQPHARGALASSTEMFVLQNANGEAILMVPADDRAPDLSWVRTMQGRKKL